MDLDKALVASLGEGLVTRDSHRGEWDPKRLHASDLGVLVPGSGCPRKLALRLQGAPASGTKYGMALMFHLGHRIHDDVRELCRDGLERRGFIVIGEEVPVPGPLAGTADWLIRKAGRVAVVDIKTLRGRAFAYADLPKPSHSCQVEYYRYYLGADEALVFYIDREGQNGGFALPAKPPEGWSVPEAVARLQTITPGGALPPILPYETELIPRQKFVSVNVKEPWQCSYCEYKGVSCPGALTEEDCHGNLTARVHPDGKVERVKASDALWEKLESSLRLKGPGDPSSFGFGAPGDQLAGSAGELVYAVELKR